MPKIIISLTSFPARINIVPKVVKRLLRQRARADLVALYLVEQQFPGHALPAELTALAADPRFQIRWKSGDLRGYDKLIPALSDFPDDIIITFDDDQKYARSVLGKLLRAHRRYPRCVICNRARLMRYPERYKNWPILRGLRRLRHLAPAFDIVPTGIGGVLYPPRSLMRTDVLRDLAPTTDDLWFWTMAVRNGTKIKQTWNGTWRPHDFADSQTAGTLRFENVQHGADGNDTAMKKLVENYGLKLSDNLV
ncbi:MAG: hypothetical protein LBL46_01115 [Rickettsiales bacterium]|jgi:hypothetical protein|nr:hypothetical protein [Rickettsiales bacterium]